MPPRRKPGPKPKKRDRAKKASRGASESPSTVDLSSQETIDSQSSSEEVLSVSSDSTDSSLPSKEPTPARRSRKMQKTLDGKPVPVKAPPKASRAKKTATPLPQTGELKPPKKPTMTLEQHAASVLPLTHELKEALGDSILHHVRGALAAAYVPEASTVKRVRPSLRGGGNVNLGDLSMQLGKPMTSEMEQEAKKDTTKKGAKPAASKAKENAKAEMFCFHSLLPCVIEYILSECSLAASRTTSAEDSPTTPLERSLEMLGYLVEMCTSSVESLLVILFVACPACRAMGVSSKWIAKLYVHLVRVGRCKVDDIVPLSREKLFALIDAEAPESRRQREHPVDPTTCCPHGTTHLFLFAALMRQVEQPVVMTITAPSLHESAALCAYLATAAEVYRRRKVERTANATASRRAHQTSNEAKAPEKRRAAVPQPISMTGLKEDWADGMLQEMHSSTRRGKACDASLCDRIQGVAEYQQRHDMYFAFCVQTDIRYPVSIYRGTLFCFQAMFRYSGESLFVLIKTVTHILGAGSSSGTVDVCACRRPAGARGEAPSSQVAWCLELHEVYLKSLMGAQDTSSMVCSAPHPVHADAVDPPSGGDSEAAPHHGQRTEARRGLYEAGTDAYYQDLHASVRGYTLGDLVRVSAESSVAQLQVDPTLAASCGVSAQLKQHQVEDIQWMVNREEEGVFEFTEVPLYAMCGTTGEPINRGTLFYCAAACIMILLPPEETAAALAYRQLRSPIRGGFLCDDVGLGKTLVLLALCARDKAMRSEDNEENEKDPVSREVAKVPSTLVESIIDAKKGGNAIPDSLFQFFFQSEATLYACPPVDYLPRVTLVVVPLSIAGQWIEEIVKFFPTARYILYYGARRNAYTVEDLAQADIIITTYETLSVHLRKEAAKIPLSATAPVMVAERKLSEQMVAKGFKNCTPAALFYQTMTYMESLRPSLEMPEGVPEEGNLNRYKEMISNYYQKRFIYRISIMPPATPAPSKKTKAGEGDEKWTVEYEDASGMAMRLPVFSCGACRVSPESSLAQVQLSPEERAAGAQLSKWFETLHFPVSFLDQLWSVFTGMVEAATAPRGANTIDGLEKYFMRADPANPRPGASAFTIFRDAIASHPPDEAVRRQLCQHVVVPLVYGALEQFWKAQLPYHLEHAQFSLTGGVPVKMTEIKFHRIILDESQKIGPTSLFHLLQADRRWVVSGTPFDNDKVQSISMPLYVLGAIAASFVTGNEFGMHYVDNGPGSHMMQQMLFYHKLTAMRQIMAEDGDPRAADATHGRLMLENYHAQDEGSNASCTCRVCCLDYCYNIHPDEEAMLLRVCRVPARHLGRPALGESPCDPASLYSFLQHYMIRHERDAAMRAALQLEPVLHAVRPIALLPDEAALYRRCAANVAAVAGQLFRQGLLTSNMAYALQWLQTLCRLALHPGLVDADILSRGEVATATAGTGSTETVMSSEEIRRTFREVAPAEALEFARQQQLHPRVIKGVPQPVSEEALAALAALAEIPPTIPSCGICLDTMAAPTLLECLHLFCQECIVGVIESSITPSGAFRARCPYCRDASALLTEKLVIAVTPEGGLPLDDTIARASSASLEREDTAVGAAGGDGDADGAVLDVEQLLARIGAGSRVATLLEVLHGIWAADGTDGVLIFSKFPAVLQRMKAALEGAGHAPLLIDGAVTLARRRAILTSLARAPAAVAGDAGGEARRILLISSRAANAGLNLTFANHVVFLEPNMNPAVEMQAIGRVHRMGQTKRVTVHHLYAVGTVEEHIYRRSLQLLERVGAAAEALTDGRGDGDGAIDAAERQRQAQIGRVAPNEMHDLLTYPIE